MSCGGSAKKKMAKGGATDKLQIYGIPQTGTTNYSAPTMQKGGMPKAKFGATVAVKASCKNGMVRSADGKCVMERPKFQSGGTTKVSKFAALAAPKNKITFADKIAGAKKKAKK
jgi:hypothetical protein